MDSPTGKIRQAIGLAKRRLQNALGAYNTIRDVIDVNPENVDDEKLYNTFEDAHEVFRKLSKNIQRIDELNAQWMSIIESMPEERAIFNKYIEDYGDFRQTADEGRQAVEHLRERIGIFRDATKTRLDLTDPRDLSEDGEGTLDAVLPNDAIFSTPATTPSRPGTPAPTGGALNPPIVAPVSNANPAPPGSWTDLLFLPNVSIPHFNGNPSQWNEFWDMFSAMVDKRNLENCLKLFQLRSCLEGEAKASLSHLGSSNQDYPIAVRTLTDLYGDPLRVTHRLRAEILQYRIHDKGSMNLYKGWSRLNQLYSQLLSMGDPADNTLLAQVLEQKFPRYVLQKVYKDAKRIPNGKEMLDAIGDVLRKESNLDRMIADNNVDYHRKAGGQGSHGKTPHQRHPAQVFTHYNAETKEGPRCHLCEGSHLTYKCSKYNEPQERQRQLIHKKLCRNCLSPGHFAPECPSTSSCRHCGQRHHSSVCFRNNPAGPSTSRRSSNSSPKVTFSPKLPKAKRSVPPTKPKAPTKKEGTHVVINEDEISDEESTEQTFHTHTRTQSKTTLLMTTPVRAINPDEPKISKTVTLFSDTGSSRSFITEELASELRLKPVNSEKVRINTFGDQSNSYQTKTYHLSINNPSSPKKISTVSLLSIPNMTSTMLAAENPEFDQDTLSVHRVRPSILIGMDNHNICTSKGDPVELPSGFKLTQTTVGPFIYGSGKTSPTTTKPGLGIYHSYMTQDGDDNPLSLCITNTEQKILSNLLSRFWSLEHLGIRDDPCRNDDDIAMEQFLKTVSRTKDGRYICRWPWKHSPSTLQNNFGRCLGRLRSTLRKLNANPDLFEKYDKVFKEQLEKGIIEVVPPHQKSQGPIHYIPHQPVITPEKTTTKLRVVYDASCKGANGKSLNDHMFRGPVLLPELLGMLLRFRATPIPLMSDVEKAFLQLELDDRDRDCTRFLWIKNPTEPPDGDNLVVYRFARVCFGVISSPFLLAACIDHHLQHYPHPLAKAMRRNSYVDNVLIECDTVEEAISSYTLSRRIFTEAKMNLREFQSSHPMVKKFLQEQGENIPDTVKVLGIPWNTNSDTISLPPWKLPPSSQPTKRSVLTGIASLFDPLGFHAPAILQAKLLLQRLWKQGKDWDDNLNEEEAKEWQSISTSLQSATPTVLPRLICPTRPCTTQLHVFCDASDRAYAAVAFLRSQSGSITEVSFLLGKSRVGPVSGMTVPRLELLALLIGSTLAKTVLAELSLLVPSETFLWTDSRITLTWLSTQRTLPVFVRNRVNVIWQNVPHAKIQYVPSLENPADAATKRDSQSTPWLIGPEWLKQAPDSWPKQPEPLPATPEEITASVEVETPTSALIDSTRFSRWSTLIRTMMIVLQFLAWTLRNSRTAPSRLQWHQNFYPKQADPTTCFHTAELLTFRCIQQTNPPTKNQIQSLNLYKDESGLYRCRTRMAHSTLPSSAIFPIFLPTQHYGTKLYIRHIHHILGHATTSTTLCQLRYRVWIPTARRLIHSVLRTCSCRTLKPFALPPFPNYPNMRVQPHPPFHFTGLDYGGPLPVQVTSSESVKSYICLFTCLTSRAIHLELVLDLSTLAFLQALRKFISRRGAPAEIWSDNAPQFKLATQTITLAWAESERIQHYLATRGIKWSFITESAPWQGGSWERLMGVTKSCLKRAIGNKRISLPEMTTVLTEVEAIVNSRPLTFVQSDFEDEMIMPIRPMDCIQPGSLIGVPLLEPWDPTDGNYEPNPSSTTKLLQLWRKQQRVLNQFWKIWSTEYLQLLSERTQTNHKQDRSAVPRTPITGEVVLVHEEGLGRGKWQLAKVLEVEKPTRIKIMLAAKPNLILRRSPKHLYPLELQPQETEKISETPEKTNKDDQHESPPLRRSKRLKTSTTFSYFLCILVLLLPIAKAENTTLAADHCSADDCAPWRYQCCTTIQQTGMIIWMVVIIIAFPLIFFLLKIPVLLVKAIKFSWTHACRICRKEPQENPKIDPRRVRRLLRRTSTLALLSCFLLTSSLVNGCSEIVSMTVNNTQCHLDDDTNQETCVIRQDIQLSLRPTNETTCLKVSTPLNNTYLLRITTEKVEYHCNFRYWYHTRDFATDVESIHRCDQAWNSLCRESFCERVTITSDLSEFSPSVRKAPGYSHCSRACGCAACGCFLCSQGCNFWRLYAKTSSEHNYRVGNCPTWSAVISIKLEANNKTSTLRLIAGHTIESSHVKYTLQAVSTPQIPILRQPVITKIGTNEAIMNAAAEPQQPTAGSLGVLQCGSENDAKAFKCGFPHEICSCDPSDFTTKCTCSYKNPKDFWDQKEARLPLTSGPVTINYYNKTIMATISQQTALLVHISFQNATVVAYYHRSSCSPTITSQLAGCRSCHNGAQATLYCETRLNTTITIQCDEKNILALPCSNNSLPITISTDDENYDKNCSYSCSDKSKGFLHIHGKLETISVPDQKSGESGQWWAKAASEVPIGHILGELGNFLTNVISYLPRLLLSHPIIALVVILGAIGAIMCLKATYFPSSPSIYYAPPVSVQRPRISRRSKSHNH